jgi:branched-chain amino acid transport system substrate-binding protein
VRTHRLRRVAPRAVVAILVPALLAALLSGCGGVSGAASGPGKQLTVYSSLPLQGPDAGASRQIVNGEKLALYQAGGRVGPFTVSYVSLDDANPTSGRWDPGVTASNAKTAADDPSTIAYLGDFDSGATAISLPLINAAGILQLSPASPYQGLASSLDAGQDEPERFYPTGRRNFARLQPGDEKQAHAQVKLMEDERVKDLYVLDDEEPFQLPLAQLVIGDAEHAGIHVIAHDSLDTTATSTFMSEAAKVARSDADAVFFAGVPSQAAVAVFRELHSADPGLWLLGSSALLDSSFTGALGSETAGRTVLGDPMLPLSAYPPSARGVLAAYRIRFAEAPGAYALYGFEAMSAALDAIRRAGAHGNDRQAVIDSLFAAGPRDSVIGHYSIQRDGETTLSSYAADRVEGGKAVYWRTLSSG